MIAAIAMALPLWKLALTMGRSEGKVDACLQGISKMLEDHEDRIRGLEAPSRSRR